MKKILNTLRKTAYKNKLFYFLLYLCFKTSGLAYAFFSILLRVFPVQKKKVVFCAMKGDRYGDNPKYISEALMSKNKDIDIVWLLKKKDNYRNIPANITIKPYSFFSNLYHYVTASVWIDSNTKEYGLLKRKKQLYIQTWHGSYGLKKMYKDIPEKTDLWDMDIIDHNVKLSDIFVSNSIRTSDIYRRAFGYTGKILECGSPRNDIFWKNQDTIREKVKQHYGIHDKKIILYAPTFRKDFDTNCFIKDYSKVINACQTRFGGEWVVLVRMHRFNMVDSMKVSKYDKTIINATDYDDIQELMVAADIMINDYSSCMFDFVTQKKPCFLYVSDKDKYYDVRGCSFALEDLPFPQAQDEDELANSITTFNFEKYQTTLNVLFEQVGLCETGHASETVANYIISFIDNNYKTN